MQHALPRNLQNGPVDQMGVVTMRQRTYQNFRHLRSGNGSRTASLTSDTALSIGWHFYDLCREGNQKVKSRRHASDLKQMVALEALEQEAGRAVIPVTYFRSSVTSGAIW